MSSPETPVVAESVSNAGPPPLPTMTRVVAVLVIAVAGLDALAVLSRLRMPSQLPAPILGMMVSPAAAIAFTLSVCALNLILAILILRRYPWALDVEIAMQVFSIVNHSLFLLSPSRGAYVAAILAQMREQMSANGGTGIDPRVFATMMSIMLSIMVLVAIAFNIALIVLLAVDRRRYRRVCLSGQA